MMRKKKEKDAKDARPSAGAKSNHKLLLPLFRHLFGRPAKESAKPPPDEGTCSRDPLPAGHGISAFLSNQAHRAVRTSIEQLMTSQAALLHLPSSASPAVDPSPFVRHTISVRQTSTSASAPVPNLHAGPPSSTDHSSISAPELCASNQQSLANISFSSDEKEPLSSPSLSQPDPAARENTSSTFAKRTIEFLRIVCEIVGVSTKFMEKEIPVNGTDADHCGVLAKSVNDLMASNIPQAVRDGLENLHGELVRMIAEGNNNVENARWKVTNYLQVLLLQNIVTGGISPDAFEKLDQHLSVVLERVKDDALRQSVTILPCANAAYNDYTKTRKRVSCFKGTRQALLEEVILWLAEPDSNVYVLFGLAGIGKSTIAQTVAETADKIRLLGASFFFSRDEEERRTAKILFTTIASQLCVHNPEFAKAIEGVLATEKGKSAIRKLPLEQLETLILEPLRKLTPRKVVVVIDALDECDDEDAPAVVMGLHKLVQSLPSFKIVLTTRPQPHLHFLLDGKAPQKIFHLHNIEEKVVDGDIELYLRHNLAWEQVRVRLPVLTNPWAASDEDIQSLVRAAGRLFIIASTAVLFILDKTSTPKNRMAKLRMALDQDHTPFKTLNDFYTTILRNAVPEDCERDTANLYQKVTGSIVLIQEPLSIHALAMLTNAEVDDITAVLGNLQSVILLDSDNIPVVYHKSFPDYIQNPARCKDEDLRIDPRFHHTRLATHCLLLLNRHLKQNMLDLCGPARFMYNSDALRNQNLAETHIQEKIPLALQYACLYFANHIESADIEDARLAEELERFFYERLPNWLEALSWIKKLDSAHRTLLTLQKQLKPRSSDLRQLMADCLRFVWKFYILIRRSALHTYHSALPFTPTKTSFYKRYSKQMSFSRVEGGGKTWEGLISVQIHSGQIGIKQVIFSSNSTLFACFMDDKKKSTCFVTVHDAVAGIALGRIEGKALAIASDFSKAVTFDDGSITLYNVKGVIPVTTIKHTATIVKLALSSDGSRLLAGLNNGTVGLWDTEKWEQMGIFGRWEKETEIVCPSDGSRAAFTSCDGVIKLLDVMDGKIVADLSFRGMPTSTLLFSGDGSRLACLDLTSLKAWNSRDGTLIGMVDDVGHALAISTDGSLLVTGQERQVKLWSGRNKLAFLKNLDLDFLIKSLEIHGDLIGIASYSYGIAIYDINSQAFVTQRLPFPGATALAFSPDCMRLAVGSNDGVQLWDVPSITATNVTSQRVPNHPTELVFSSDCMRLVSGHDDGAIQLWDTFNIALLAVHSYHSTRVTALAFNANGEEIASGDADGAIYLWSGGGEPRGTLKCSDKVTAVALSDSMIAASTTANITLWDLKTHSHIVTLDQGDTNLLAFSHHHSFLAAAKAPIGPDSDRSTLTVWDIVQHVPITTFNLTSTAWRMRFLPDGSRLAIRDVHNSFHLFDFHDNRWSEVSENQDISLLGLCPNWHGIPTWMERYGIVGRFPQRDGSYGTVTALICYNPIIAKVAEGSSMIALCYRDGRIVLIKSI